MFLEFLIPLRPLSLQAKGSSLVRSKQYIREEASRNWSDEPYVAYDVHLTIIYFCHTVTVSTVDTDNIIKPIQDALIGLVYKDDGQITDVDSHRRLFVGEHDITEWPPLLVNALNLQAECLYVRVKRSGRLEDHL